MKKRLPLIAGAGAVLVVIALVWFWATAGRESTDDAQVDAHVTPIAARVGGLVLRVPVGDNQQVDAGAVLVDLDRGEYTLVCLFPDPEGIPHLAQGMEATFTVE